MTPAHQETRHHLFSPRNSYQTKEEKVFYNHPDTSVRALFGIQQEIHTKLDHCPKPSREHRIGALAYLAATHEDIKQAEYWNIHRLIGYFAMESIRPTARNTQDITVHLSRQLSYLTRGET